MSAGSEASVRPTTSLNCSGAGGGVCGGAGAGAGAGAGVGADCGAVAGVPPDVVVEDDADAAGVGVGGCGVALAVTAMLASDAPSLEGWSDALADFDGVGATVGCGGAVVADDGGVGSALLGAGVGDGGAPFGAGVEDPSGLGPGGWLPGPGDPVVGGGGTWPLSTCVDVEFGAGVALGAVIGAGVAETNVRSGSTFLETGSNKPVSSSSSFAHCAAVVRPRLTP